MPKKSLRIALMGTRGIPASYGGFETFAEELSTRLAQAGHSVSVYARHALGSAKPQDFVYKGVTVRSAPTIMHKYLETPLHSFFSFLDTFKNKYDVVLLCNAANAPFAWMGSCRGLPVLINVDGIERKRGKWNMLGKSWYWLGEICSVLFAKKVIADARVIAEYYQQQYGIQAQNIAYGAKADFKAAGEVLKRFGLQSGRYVLYVSRLEPENNALGVIEAHRLSELELPLVIVGDAPYADAYKERLRSAASSNVIFSGFQFGDAYRELRSHCYLYVQATEVGGTHPALLEAMAHGNCVIANDVPEHREVLADCGLYYAKNNFSELATLLRTLSADALQVRRYGEMARERAAKYYNWDEITRLYEELFIACCAAR